MGASTAADFSGVVFSSSSFILQPSSLSVRGLSANTTYYFRVGSLNWSNAANYSSGMSAKTLFETPVISSMTPETGQAGTGVVLTGTSFGEYDTSTTTYVTFDESTAAISSWSGAEVDAIVPESLELGTYTVMVVMDLNGSSVTSNGVIYTVDRLYQPGAYGSYGTLNVLAMKYPDSQVKAGLRLKAKSGGSMDTFNRTSIRIEPEGMEKDTFVSISADKPDDREKEARVKGMVSARVTPVGVSALFGPEDLKLLKPAGITLPYIRRAIPRSKSEKDLGVYYWDAANKTWAALDTVIDLKNTRLAAKTDRLGVYQAMAMGVVPESAVDATFKLGEVYAYPNPAKRMKPTLHVECGLADRVEIRIYDVAGDMRHQAGVDGSQWQIIDDGHGPEYAYEYTWDTGGAGSGVYIYVVEATKAGYDSLKTKKKLAIIK